MNFCSFYNSMSKETRLRDLIPPEIVAKSDYRMSKVLRWKKDAVIQSKKPESNLDHVSGMHLLAEELRSNYPVFASAFDWIAVENMIDVHDIGEIVTGDLVISRPDYLEVKKKHKQTERKGFFWLINRYIEDPKLREDLAKSYIRYTDLDPNDPEALLTHLLDKVQAIRFGLTNVYNDRIFPLDVSLEQAGKSIDLIFNFANPLISLTSGEVKSQLLAFVQVELGRYRKSGYPELADEARRRLFRVSK